MKKIIDVRNKPCPEPVLETKKALQSANFSELEIITNSDVSKENISRFLNSMAINFEVSQIDGDYHIYIKGSQNISDIPKNEDKKKQIFIISKNYLGEGDKTLGEILIKSFFHTLNELDELPQTLFFVNSGVYLTVSQSPILEDIKNLECKGVEILSCGTCLDYYHLKEKLAVGKIGNMYRLLELLKEGGILI
jgi:selenium metabolism protein YedF